MRNRTAVIALTIAALTAPAAAQSFDVVSIVVDRAGTGGAGDRFPKHGTWHWTRIPLAHLVMYAYDVSLRQIAGIPKEFDGPEIAFDIRAKMPPDVTESQFRAMVRSMLAERFQFAMHREMRDMPVYTIEVAKGGPKLVPASGQCIAAQQTTVVPEDQYLCGVVTWRPQGHGQSMHHQYIGRSVSVANLAAVLSPNGPVIDDTGIQGLWDIDVNFESASHRASETSEETQADYAHVFKDAFEKQLGLTIDYNKLKKRPLPVVVIDHVELPTPN